MKFFVNVFLALNLAISAVFLASCAQPAAEVAPPTNPQAALMIIRFNQPGVNYGNKLAYVVREAVKTKPDVVFDVVAVSGNEESKYGQQVADNIAQLGVAKSQINLRRENGSAGNEEVRIFVR